MNSAFRTDSGENIKFFDKIHMALLFGTRVGYMAQEGDGFQNSVWEAIVWGTLLYPQTSCCNKPTSCVFVLLCRFAIEHCLNCYGRKIEGGDSDTGKLLVCSLVPRPCLIPRLTSGPWECD